MTSVTGHLVPDVSTQSMSLICEMSSLENETAAKCVWLGVSNVTSSNASVLCSGWGVQVRISTGTPSAPEYPFSHSASVSAGKFLDSVLYLDTAAFFHISDSFVIDCSLIIRYSVVWLTNGVKVQVNE